MCYSKEVQLITAVIILLSCAGYYVYYQAKFRKKKAPWLLPFLRYCVLAFVFIGLHQLFEFLSLVSQSQVIYKIGLLFSISVMYFALRSFEILMNKKVYSWIALILIAAVAIHLFLVPVAFSEAFFYVRHYSTFFWGAAWLVLFGYWHLCVWNKSKELDTPSKKILGWYLLAGTDIAFLLSVLYVLVGYVYFGVNVCYDSPSIWCTFMVLQAIFVPFFLSMVPSITRRKASTLPIKKALLYFTLSVMTVLLLAFTLPFFGCFTWKFVFP